MITDNQTNTIYFSDLLKSDPRFVSNANQLTTILDSFGLDYHFLPNTKDIWARDYMPVQISDSKYIEFRYDPNYLQGDYKGFRDLKTYPDLVCDSIRLTTIKSDLILDGGNLVKASDCLILTDKVVQENQMAYSKNDLIDKIKQTFDVSRVVLIPWFKEDVYGHSDGILRFIDDETVLISDLYIDDTVLLYRLKQNGLKWKFLNLNFNKPDDRQWAYINFLQTKDLIIIPALNIDEDKQAFEQLKIHFPVYARDNRIRQIEMANIIEFGGALNCISWTTKE